MGKLVPYHVMKESYMQESFAITDEDIKVNCLDEYADICRNTTDPLEKALRSIDLCSMLEGNMSESVVASGILREKIITESLTDNIPDVVPYFTPEEMRRFSSNNNDFIEDYRENCVVGLQGFDYSRKFSLVKNLYELYSIDRDEKYAKQIIELGWNPSVAPNEAGLEVARKRISKYIKENYDTTIIDVSDMYVHETRDLKPRENIYPVFILLTFVNSLMNNLVLTFKGGKYGHASISFEPDLHHLYSFGMDESNKSGGITFEDIDNCVKRYDKATMKLMCVFISKHQRDKLRSKLDYYIMNTDKTRYDVVNLFRIFFNKSGSHLYNLNMVCSQFVDALLRSAGVELFDKSNNLVTPIDFEKVNNKKIYILYEGLVSEYDWKKVDDKVKALASDKSNAYRQIGAREAVDLLFNHRDILLYKSISVLDEGESYMNDIHNLLHAELVCSEAKLPFNISNDGDVEITFPDKLEEEYQKSHKLLLEYDRVNDTNGMKSELAKLWYLNNVAERKLKKKFANKTSVTRTRARILNDFKKYLKVVLDKEPDFNFTEYFNNSPYYDKSIVIDASTLKWSGRLLKAFLTK